MESFEDSQENPEGGSTEVWTGKSFSTYEGTMGPNSVYPIFVQELRSVDVELLDGDADSRFVPCDEDYSCGMLEEPGYEYVGYVYVSHTDTWRVRFSGDVIGDSDVMIRQVNIMDDTGVTALGLGCTGLCLSLLVLLVGMIFGLTLKDRQTDPLSDVSFVEGVYHDSVD
jgi:hypothetical protein